MAKKKNEKSLQYLQMPLPEGGKYSKMTKLAFGGLNKRYTTDSGELSMEENISTKEYPYLTPAEVWEIVYGIPDGAVPISMAAFEGFYVVIYRDGKYIKLDYVDGGVPHTGIIKTLDSEADNSEDEIQRSIVQFNVYDTPTDPLTGQYVKKLLIFPDKVSLYMNIVKAKSNPEGWNADDLVTKDLNVMYYYDSDNKRQYFTVSLVKREKGDDDYDENKVTYKRVVNKKSEIKKTDEEGNETDTITLENAFFCDGMEVIVKAYRNKTPEIDASGATIYPPPDTASHNYYYRNAENNDVYRWCEYETAKRLDEWGLDSNLDEDGNIIDETANKDGFILDGDNYITDGGTEYGWKVAVPPSVPNLKYATVHLSRVFGVDDGRVYASGYNDYTNWNLDTTDEYNEGNAWCSPSQSNAKAGGNFTGITTFQGHVVCFKKDFMHEIYNTKNPFRLTDIYAEGTIDNRTIQDVDGKLIFVSEDDVKVYTGSNPRIIGYNLNMPRYSYAVSGTDNRNYYLYCEGNTYTDNFLYVYDTYNDLWSEYEISPEIRVLNFAHNNDGMCMLCDDGDVYRIAPNTYDLWSFETDLITNQTVDIKHIKKLQMLVEHPKHSSISVYILYDNEEWGGLSPEEKEKRCVYASTKHNKSGKYPIRVKPRKTANFGFKLHVEGLDYVKLYELEIFVESGGDMYV